MSTAFKLRVSDKGLWACTPADMRGSEPAMADMLQSLRGAVAAYKDVSLLQFRRNNK